MGGKLVDESMFAWVLAHPIRCRALTILASREASPVEIGEEIGVGASHVAYHVRVLLRADLIELAEEVPSSGSIEHRYAAIDAHRLTDDRYLALAPKERARRVYNTFCFAVADANCALSAGQFERDHSLGRFPVEVDRTGWSEVGDLFDTMQAELDRIQAVARVRMDLTGAEATAALAFFTLFRLPPETRRQRASDSPVTP